MSKKCRVAKCGKFGFKGNLCKRHKGIYIGQQKNAKRKEMHQADPQRKEEFDARRLHTVRRRMGTSPSKYRVQAAAGSSTTVKVKRLQGGSSSLPAVKALSVMLPKLSLVGVALPPDKSSAGVVRSKARTPVTSAGGVVEKGPVEVQSSTKPLPKSSAGVFCSKARTPVTSAGSVVDNHVEVQSSVSNTPLPQSSAGVVRSKARTPVTSAGGTRRLSFADDQGRSLESSSTAPDIIHPEEFPSYPEWIFSCSSNLDAKQREEVKELADLLQAHFIGDYSRSTTHLIVKTDGNNLTGRTPEYLRALVRGTWIVSSDWVKGALADPSYIGPKILSFEALDEETEGKPGAQRARRGRYSDEPLLFDNVEVCLVGEMVSYDIPLLRELIEYSGGRLVSSPTMLTSNGCRCFLVSESPLHSERHRSELTSYMFSSGAQPVSVDYILDCITSHEMLKEEGTET